MNRLRPHLGDRGERRSPVQPGSGSILAAVTVGAGIALAMVVAAHVDFASVVAAIRSIGPRGFLAVVLAQAVLCAPLGLAWWAIARGQPARRIAAFAWASLIAEAAASVLPFSQVGGAAIASRAAAVAGIEGRVAVASNIVDITLELAAQVVFTFYGAAYLAHRLRLGSSGATMLSAATIWGVGIVALVLAGLLAAQKWGLRLLELVMHRLAPAGPDPAVVTRAIRAAYRRPRRLAAAFALHLATWLTGVAGAWLILRFIGSPRPFLSVAAMESLLLAVRNAAFMIPAGLGVQEGAYVLLAPLFGLSPSVALALSLLKRGRDVAIGVPALLSWQALEIRRPLRRRRASPADCDRRPRER